MQRSRPYKSTPFKQPRKISKTAIQRKQSIQDARGFSRFLGGKAEKKVIDLAPANYACSTTGSVTALNLCATGSDFTDRVGKKILMKSINILGHFIPTDSAVSPCLCRVMLIYDKQPTGTLPVITDILKTSDSRDQLNLNNRDRFAVLCNMLVALGVQQNTATQSYAGSPTEGVIHIYKKLNHEVIYNNTTAVIGAIASGTLLLVTIGDQAAGADYQASVSTRVRFIDA